MPVEVRPLWGARTRVITSCVIAPWSSVLQPVGEPLADIDRERQLFVAIPLPADHHLPGAPIDVMQLDRGDLAGA